MSKLFNRPCKYKIGDLVYRAYRIQNPGKVIQIREEKDGKQMVTFKTQKGELIEVWDNHLNSYSKALEDHKRKYEKFNQIAKALQKMDK